MSIVAIAANAMSFVIANLLLQRVWPERFGTILRAVGDEEVIHSPYEGPALQPSSALRHAGRAETGYRTVARRITRSHPDAPAPAREATI
jgi:hypothetical protein